MSVALTSTEARVAAFVAAGSSNREIAAQLGLSRRTVEWHLSKVYRKLGVRSRTQLVARLAANGDLRSSRGSHGRANERVGPLSETPPHVISESHRERLVSEEGQGKR